MWTFILFALTAQSAQNDPPEQWVRSEVKIAEILAADTAVEIVNHFGDVRIRNGPAHEIKVTAILKNAASEPDGLKARLKQQDDGPTRIAVTYQGVEENTHHFTYRRADLHVYLPAVTAVRVRASRGLIEAKPLKNDLDLDMGKGTVVIETTGGASARIDVGSITAALIGPGGKTPCFFQTNMGNISLLLPAKEAFGLVAKTKAAFTTDYFSLDIRPDPNTGFKQAQIRNGTGGRQITAESDGGQIFILAKSP